ncbi:aminopeptidase T. Metallo peptidase. MEROPS family M29 [Loktanella fryxellensis]|uniref:Aminopeptidase T. Metallo peptidase. MEROPS family M29 n=1 Tax=Loktanella fryxellensis TaxID=245187 RepID=A0A1H8ASU0_9RHOB|nr:aminopeptidase [Loktanella fryxellensis]SEM73623.1 aminopeptidase T. Metallo peptidase. MEROPS family M29 [Loktanella fryxellensis]
MSDHLDPVKLDRLAEVAVRTGVNLQPGQDLIITANMSALPLVQRIAVHAYKAGAGLVIPFFTDDAITLARYENAADDSFDRAPAWFYEGLGKAYKAGAARMAITGDDPMLLAEQDPARVARASKAVSIAAKPAMQPIVGFEVNWNIVAFPGAAWAARVFPDLPVDQAQGKLLDAIYDASRLGGDDPVANWADHTTELKKRVTWLNDQNFTALHYTGPGTDLHLGLAEGHIWKGGASPALNGVVCQPNIPTEEVFTCPHAYKADGTVAATKPLAYQGTVIRDIAVRFEAGRIVAATASSGEAVFRDLLKVDDGSSRIGEVALVPHSSPISQSGTLFYNTLFDENASCHIALGQCYADTITGGSDLSEDELKQKGGNQSLIHVDWMMGSDAVDIDGIGRDGVVVPVMRRGEWAF